jgi:transposase
MKLGRVVVMYNTTFHKQRRTKDLIHTAGHSLIFILPYSPDLNPIENNDANGEIKKRKKKEKS